MYMREVEFVVLFPGDPLVRAVVELLRFTIGMSRPA
jgi:hypothetical protein